MPPDSQMNFELSTEANNTKRTGFLYRVSELRLALWSLIGIRYIRYTHITHWLDNQSLLSQPSTTNDGPFTIAHTWPDRPPRRAAAWGVSSNHKSHDGPGALPARATPAIREVTPHGLRPPDSKSII